MFVIATYQIQVSQLREIAPSLRVADRVELSGTIYTARDAAHKRIATLLDEGKPLPFSLQDAVIYYAGPTPAPQGMPIGSCGPTTASRMDPFTPRLMDLGVVATIGKGERSQAVYDAIVRNGGVYLCALGGAAALAAGCVTESQVIAFEDLGCESIKRLTICSFPLIVGADVTGADIFSWGKKQYQTAVTDC